MVITSIITSNRTLPWLDAGYQLFIEEGHKGIQVERLAKKLGRNKSAFYHFFGERETYIEFLLKYHLSKMDKFIEECRDVEHYDPHYLTLLLQNRELMLFNSQLVRNSHMAIYQEALREINQREDSILLPLWSNYLGLNHSAKTSKGLYEVVRGYMYTRITSESFHYDYMSSMAKEIKDLLRNLSAADGVHTGRTVL